MVIFEWRHHEFKNCFKLTQYFKEFASMLKIIKVSFKFCVRLKIIFLKKDDVCKLTESRLIYKQLPLTKIMEKVMFTDVGERI
jgi:hypothetical protein